MFAEIIVKSINQISRRFRLGLVVALAMFCCMLAGCAGPQLTSESGAIEYSAQVIWRRGQPYVFSQTWFPFPGESRPLAFADPVVLITNGAFGLEIEGQTADQADPIESGCANTPPMQDFKEISNRLAELLKLPPRTTQVVFQIATGQTPNASHVYASVQAESTLTVRLFFVDDGNDCDRWWEDVLGTFLHEFVHVYLDWESIDSPNSISEEVLAYSIEKCALAEVRSLSRLVSTEFEMDVAEHVSRKGYATVVSSIVDDESGLSDSLIGKILSDLHLQLLLSKFEGDPSSGQLNHEHGLFCEGLISSNNDFTVRAYLPSSD